MPHIDYSARSLLDKLNVRDDARVLLVGNFSADFAGDIARRASVLTSTRAASLDLVFLLADEKKTLLRVGMLAKKLSGPAALWIVAPRGVKHIREIDVLNAGRAAGLTDNKVVRFSDTHTAHKFVIPLSAR